MALGDRTEGLDRDETAFWERLHEQGKVQTEQSRQIGELTGAVKGLANQFGNITENIKSVEQLQRDDTAKLMTAITTSNAQNASALREANKAPALAPYIAIVISLAVGLGMVLNWLATAQQRETGLQFESVQASIVLILERMAADDIRENKDQYDQGVQDTEIATLIKQQDHFDQIRHDKEAAAKIAQNFRDMWLGALESRVASGETSMMGIAEYMKEHTGKEGPSGHPIRQQIIKTESALGVQQKGREP